MEPKAAQPVAAERDQDFLYPSGSEKEKESSSCYYPIFVRLKNRKCLVVGGGTVGERKIRTLLRHGAAVSLVAREMTDWLKACCRDGEVLFLGEKYEQAHLNDIHMVFAATDDSELNKSIARDAMDKGIWCNMATDPQLGDFIIPSSFHVGPLNIAVSTSGLSPAYARQIRRKLESDFGTEWGLALEIMGRLRSAIQRAGLPSSENQRIFREISCLPLPELIRKKDRGQILRSVREICKSCLNLDEINRILDDLW